MQERSLKIDDCTDTIPMAFELTFDDNQQYQIQDGTGSNLTNLPIMPQQQIIPEEVCDVLEHLIRFRLVSDLINEASAVDYLGHVEISIKYGGKSYGSTDNIAMKHNTIAEVIVANKSPRPVFVCVYDLGPSWQVEQMFGGSYYVINPRGTTRKRFTMTIPEVILKQGNTACEDVLKVIVTSQPTSFDMLELPRLRELARRKGSRKNRGATEGQGDWTATNFTIHTSVEEQDSSMVP